jgi:hypothetical protein
LNGVLVVLPWIVAVVVVVVLPVALMLFADDGPRNDDPPDTGEGAYGVAL